MTLVTAGIEDLVARVATLVTEPTSPTHRPAVILSPNHILEVSTGTPAQTSNALLQTSNLCQRPNGDQPLSTNPQGSPDPPIQAPTVTNSSPFSDPIANWEPILTYLGIKWVPTITDRHNRTCPNCPVCDECSDDVDAGDFAWCRCRRDPTSAQPTTS